MNPLRTLLLLLAALLAVGCSEQGVEEGRYSLTVITHDEHALDSGQVTIGPLVIAGGAMTVEVGAEQRGWLIALAGEVHIDGLVDGTVLALGADVEIGEQAVVTGDLQQAGGTLVRAPGAVVQGEIIEDQDPSEILGEPDRATSLLDRAAWVAFTIVAMAGLAGLTTLVAPRLTGRVQTAGVTYPLVAGALGTLVWVMAPALIASMVLTLILMPLALIVAALLGCVLLFGLVGIGRGAGAILVRRLELRLSTPMSAALGTAALVGVLHLASFVPVLGAVSLVLVAVVGSGAVLLTGFGTRSYVPPVEAVGAEAMEMVSGDGRSDPTP